MKTLIDPRMLAVIAKLMALIEEASAIDEFPRGLDLKDSLYAAHDAALKGVPLSSVDDVRRLPEALQGTGLVEFVSCRETEEMCFDWSAGHLSDMLDGGARIHVAKMIADSSRTRVNSHADLLKWIERKRPRKAA
jgi:hypothetical protein